MNKEKYDKFIKICNTTKPVSPQIKRAAKAVREKGFVLNIPKDKQE